MSYIEWFFIGLIILFFVIVMFYSWMDLSRDKKYYINKKKNVKSIDKQREKNRERNKMKHKVKGKNFPIK